MDSTLAFHNSTGAAEDNSVEAVRGHDDGLGLMDSITEGKHLGNSMDYMAPISEMKQTEGKNL